MSLRRSSNTVLSAVLFAGLATASVAWGAPAGAAAPQSPSAATARYLDQVEAVEERAYVRRGAKGAIKATGWISETHADAVKGAKPIADGLLLHTDDGKSFELKIPKSAKVTSTKPADPAPRDLSEGDVVVLDGTLNGGTITVSAVQASAAIVTPGLGPIQNTADRAVQTRSVLTILANFDGDSQPVTQQQINTAMYSTTAGVKSAANFFNQTSRGRFLINGQATPWLRLTVPRTTSCTGSTVSTWMNDAEVKARAAGFEPDNFDRVVLVTPESVVTDCVYYGIATSSRRSLTWADSDPQPNPFRTGTAIHELGHNFGLYHSSPISCKASGVWVPISDDCSYTDSDDPSDIMGDTENSLTFQGFTRAALGFTPLANVQTIPVDGAPRTLTRSTAALGTTPQLLRIRRPSAAPSATDRSAFYYLDYRGTESPFDNFPTGHSSTTGVSLHLAGDFVTSPAYGNWAGTPSLVNMAPGSSRAGNFKVDLPRVNGLSPDVDAALQPGQNLYDPIENITITTVSADAQSAQVRAYSGPPEGATTAVTFNGTAMTITGAANRPNGIAVNVDGTDLTITDFGSRIPAPAQCRTLSPVSIACPRSAVSSLKVDVGAGNDYVYVYDNFPYPTTLIGGPGNDTLLAGAPGSKIEFGSAPDGADTVSARRGGIADYSARTAPLSFGSASGRATLAGEGDLLGGLDIVGGQAGDTFTFADSITADGGAGVDHYRTVPGTMYRPEFVSRDGVAETDIDCADRAILTADPSDTPVNCTFNAVFDPQAVITGGLAAGAVTSGAVPAFTFTSPFVAATGFQCKLLPGSDPDQGTWSPCGGTSYTPTITADGEHVFVVQALNGTSPAGSRIYRRFTVDTTVDTTATPAISPTSVTYTLAAPSDPFDEVYECAFDTPTFTRCQSPVKYSGLANGSQHTFKARAIDGAGNVDSSPATHTFTADSVPPQTTITAGPVNGSATESTSATVSFTASEPGSTFGCSLDGAPRTPCTSPITLSGLSVGSHTFLVAATDPAGNFDGTTDASQRTWTVVAPFSTTITSGPPVNRYTNDSTPTFTFTTTAPAGSTFECKYASLVNYVACASPFTLPALADGSSSTFSVRAKTSAGAVDNTPASQVLSIDLTPPDVQIDSGPAADATVTTSPQTFTFSSPGAASPATCGALSPPNCVTYVCKLDASPEAPCSSPYTTAALTAGQHTLVITATDAAGNVDASPLSRTFTYSAGPMLSISGPVAPTSPVNLTSDPMLGATTDWIHWKGSTSTQFDRRTGTPQISTWSKLGSTAAAAFTGPTTFSWTNATGSVPSGSSAAGVGYGLANGRGFRITAPATNTQVRKLKLWVGVRGSAASGRLAVGFGGVTTVNSTALSSTSSTALTPGVYTVTYRSSAATDTLRLDWTQLTGGTTGNSLVLLYAAAMA